MTSMAPMMLGPAGERPVGEPGVAQPPIDLSQPGDVAWGIAEPTIIDTRTFPVQIQNDPWNGAVRRVREVLPPHGKPPVLVEGEPNNLPVGGLGERQLADPVPGQNFPGIGQTPWTPPDPALAVGPNHVVATVNMDIAFYTKAGTLQFQSRLDNTGNPGFFESVGGGSFTFDPKCFYDHYTGRFFVLALEVYGSTQSFITFAVSDDSDPNGVWFKYRTNSVITVGANTYWFDYPGMGFDGQAFYVTGNLFGLNNGGWAGVGFRVFDKTPLLSGGAAVYSTLRDGAAASVQVCQHFGATPIAPYFASVNNNSSLRIHAITNPLTNPVLVSTTVNVPSFSNPTGAPAAGGNSVSLVDNRIFNCQWRDGNLYATHNVQTGGKNQARWYHMATNNWPNSGSISLTQSGNVDGGSGVHTYFPAIYSDQYDNVGLVCGASSSTTRISVNVTGRTPGDPAGQMAALTQLQLSAVNGGGRWGDYYDIAVDPVDDSTFWIVGEMAAAGGWTTWIDSFQIATPPPPPPADITGLQVIEGGVAESWIFWTDNANNEDNVELERQTKSGANWVGTVLTTLPANTTNHIDPSGLGGFRFRARAVNTGGASNWTAYVNRKPNKPLTFSVSQNAGVVTLVWTDDSTIEYAYNGQRQQRVNNTWTNQVVLSNVPANSTTRNDTPGSGTWRYRVKARNTAGDSAWTVWRQIVVP